MKTIIRSVAYYASNIEIRKAVIKSDLLRLKTLDRCYAIAGYTALPWKERCKVYDLVKKEIEANNE